MLPTALTVTSFNIRYDLKGFDCDNKVLNDYLIKYAAQDIKRHLSSVYLCTTEKDELLGYYTLSSNHIDTSSLPEEYTKKLPRYPFLSAILIGRLAIDKKHKGKGFGEYLLMHAAKQSMNSGIAAFAIIVEAKDASAKSFYKRYGFIEFVDKNNKLFLPMSVIAKLFE